MSGTTSLRLAPLMVLIAAGLSFSTVVWSRQQKPSPPNILLIQADDLGYGDLSAYGQGRFETPALDRLAREGIRFTQYYAGSTVCAPSRDGADDRPAYRSCLDSRQWRDPAAARGRHDRRAAARCRLSHRGHRQMGPRHRRARPASPTSRASSHSFGFLDHRHAHRQYTDHLWRNGEACASRSRARLRERPVHEGSGGVHRSATTSVRSSST